MTPGGKKGKGKFGWSICQAGEGKFLLSESGVTSGVAKYAEQAFEQVSKSLKSLSDNPRILAIGIDAPLFWNITGKERKIDAIIRDAVKKAAKSQGNVMRPGTKRPDVQPVNSLRGACLVQGILVGASLYQHFKAPITEVHPGALSWLKPATFDYIHRLTVGNGKSDHERDAMLAAYAARAMHKDLNGWRDLFPEEPHPVFPLGTPASYWMPIP